MTLNPEEYGIWIDRHLRGELTEEEHIVFERKLGEDASFAKRWTDTKEIYAGIRQSVLEEKWALLESWDDGLTGNPDGIVEEVHAEHNTRILVWLAAVAVIVLGFILMWPDDKTQNKGPSQEYIYLFEPGEFKKTIEHSPFNSDVEDPLTLEQRKAYDLYSAQLFDEAIPLLKDLWEVKRDSLAFKYLGYSLIGSGKTQEGEVILDHFERQEPSK